ncbi:MAG: hypothetical protein GXP54_01915 [Deltaproteobacteria bacterium]|nr:hypothetical protein [Deltaproteobacteria bacterium]
MKPLLTTLLVEPVVTDGELDRGLLRVLPPERRDRLVLAWPGTDFSGFMGVIRRAALAGFKRVRVAFSGTELDEGALESVVRAGADEIEIEIPLVFPLETVRRMREAGTLSHVTMTLNHPCSPDETTSAIPNPCGADELKVVSTGGASMTRLDALVEKASDWYRRLSVRGAPLCRLNSLGPGKVLSNTIEARFPPGVLRMGFERPERVYHGTCHGCGLALACDGHGYEALAHGKGMEFRAFDAAGRKSARMVSGRPSERIHPSSFITGLPLVLGVSKGIRPCGRIVITRANLDRQIQMLKNEGLYTNVVAPDEAPEDCDRGGDGPDRLFHVFFSVGSRNADEAAALERDFTAAENSGRPLGPEAFARSMGQALGYPRCCVDAFVAAGADATTSDLIRAAHGRSHAFDWRLNCLDPLSPFTLVPHVPCSFDCEASVAIGDGVADALAGAFPFIDGTARELLGRTVLFIDQERAVAFDGKADPDGRGARYHVADLLLARRPVEAGSSSARAGFVDAIMPVLWASDGFRVEGNSLVIKRNEKEVFRERFDERPLVFPFGQS